MPFYIVYRGLQRYRDGSVKPRVRVRKIRDIPRGARPRIVKAKKRGGDLFVTIKYRATFTARNKRKYKRTVLRDIHLGRGDPSSVKITRNPPKGPKVDRKKKRRR